LGDLGDAGNVNLALGGPIAPSNFGLGLGYAEYELAPGVKQTEIRHFTDLRSQSDCQVHQVGSLGQCRLGQRVLTFCQSSRIHSPTENQSHIKRQNQYLLMCCAGTRLGTVWQVCASHLAMLTTKLGGGTTSQGPIMALCNH
jgi:hypothetical protein